ncbi:MAG: amidohydrolase family protein [Clostridia bacterium]|nr:amidohydrolase family protein [Clostridia bacterium]
MRKIIDSHLHISKWGDEDFISCFDEYCKEQSIHALNICAIPSRQSNVCNNIIMGFYKLARPKNYIHGGIELINIPIDNMPKDMDAVTQYRELMEIGFDGIKMLEGKPTEHKRIGKDLNHPSLNALYKEIEKDGTHLIMHVNDPDEFWDLKRAPDWAIKAGWTYTDGTYSSYEDIHNQTLKVLEDYPNISVTIAHFFFCGKEPEILERLFKLYPNFCVDLTPGGEMYVEFQKNYDYYKEFFNKYSDRLIFGTDSAYLGDNKYEKWLFNVVTTFIGTDKPVSSFDDKILCGLGMSQEKVDNIFYANFERRVGKEPKKIDKEKFRAYIEKYSFALTDEDKKRIEPLIKKYL